MRGLIGRLIVACVSVGCLAGPTSAAEESGLLTATRRNDTAAVKAALKKSKVNDRQPDGTTALAWAVYNDNVEATALLLKAGADANLTNDYGVGPLALACENGNSRIVGLLLASRANPNLAQSTGKTPLMLCARKGAVEAVKGLLATGADPNIAEPRDGQTALMWAVAGGHPQVVRALIEHRADIRARSKVRALPEPFVVERKVNFYGRNYPPTTRFRKTAGGFTPLLFAAQRGDIETATLLLGAGADVNDRTEEDGSALVIAIASGHEPLALFLLQKGADPNASDGNGLTALHYSLHAGLQNLAGMRPAPSDRFGWIRPNMPAVMKALLARGADPNARVKHSWPFVANDFIGRTTDEAHQVDMTGATPFLLAAASGDAASMRALVAAGADPKAVNVEGVNAVVLAAGLGTELKKGNEKRYLEAARVAIELGVDVNGKHEQDGRTALHAAVTQGWPDMVRFLVASGVKIDAKDMWGQTALTIAMGDPEDVIYRPYPGGNKEDRFRVPRPSPKMEALLLELGHPPFAGKFADKSGR